MRFSEAMKEIGGGNLTAYRSGWSNGFHYDSKEGPRIGIVVMDPPEGPAEILSWLVPAGKESQLVPAIVLSDLTAEDVYANDWQVD